MDEENEDGYATLGVSLSLCIYASLSLSVSLCVSVSLGRYVTLSLFLSLGRYIALSLFLALSLIVRVRACTSRFSLFFYLVACLHSICKPHSDVTPNLRLLQKGTQMKLTPTTRKREMPPMKQMQGSTEFQRTYQGKGKGPPLHPQRQSLNG